MQIDMKKQWKNSKRDLQVHLLFLLEIWKLEFILDFATKANISDR